MRHKWEGAQWQENVVGGRGSWVEFCRHCGTARNLAHGRGTPQYGERLSTGTIRWGQPGRSVPACSGKVET